jgi:hypothetical protein
MFPCHQRHLLHQAQDASANNRFPFLLYLEQDILYMQPMMAAAGLTGIE